MRNGIQKVLDELNIHYRITGDEAMARCPSHDDNHPSWSCNIRTGVHHCFSCGYAGNLASLASLVLGLSYPESVIWVNSRAGMARAHQWREDYEQVSFSPPRMKIDESHLALFGDVPFVHLANRQITSEAASKFGVRWNYEDPSWIFPVRDPYTNELWGWQLKNARYFRSYPAGLRKSQTCFGLSASEHGGTYIIVESPVDAVRLYAAGIPNGLALFGVSLSDRQLSLVLERADSVVLALDNDSAGVSETARICKHARELDDVRIFRYPEEGKDPGDLSNEEIQSGIINSVGRIRWMREYANGNITPVSGGTSKKIS